MSLTKPVNSKSNIKQFTDADLPFSPRQPVIARYAAESTLNQTVISLPFQVDTVNAADSFILTVDGKVLTPGATNDYQFSGVDSFGFSNSVTLNYPIAAALNIQGIKLGLKKETDFLQDARLTQIYEGMDQGFQGFIRTSDLMVATTSVGAPSAGNFHSIIQNRTNITDLSRDLKVQMGVSRIMTQSMFQIQNEFGPNGEIVYGIPNDLFGQVRVVGNTWATYNSTSGQGISSSSTSDFVEITFYGTGLNLLTFGFNQARSWQAYVDGVSIGTITQSVATTSQILSTRNSNQNTVVQVVSNLALGIHTVRLQISGANGGDIFGVEILNESNQVRVNPGSSYAAGKKLVTVSQSSSLYNSAFETGTLGTRGGRVIVYQKADGTVGKAVQPANASQALFGAADHSNEDIARVYNFREFGANLPGVDFSTDANPGALTRAFTLDDGTTSLVLGGSSNLTIGPNSGNAVGIDGNGGFLSITFTGTGLDIQRGLNGGTTGTNNVFIDGTNVGSLSTTAVALQTLKVVSGLPYGTHTIRFAMTGAGAAYSSFRNFIVYQPKKPTIPAGAVELADYNVLGNYSFNSTNSSPDTLSAGMIYKSSTREARYTGANFSLELNAAVFAGNRVITTGNGQTAELVFFGTGFELIYWATLNEGVKSFTIDGLLLTAANFPGVTVQVTAGLTYNNTNGQVSGTPNAVGSKVSISGLSLGTHTVLMNKVSGTNCEFDGYGIITPIHSHRVSSQTLQNAVTIGNQGISDDRNFTPLKNDNSIKSLSRAYGIVTGVTTSSTALIPMPDMSVTHQNKTGKIRISYSVSSSVGTGGNSMGARVYVNGIAVEAPTRYETTSAGYVCNCTDTMVLNVAPGINKIEVYWVSPGGVVLSLTSFTARSLTVEEI